MPTAKKLPSGSWNCRVFSHYEYVDGKKVRKYQSFTCDDPSALGKKKCEAEAAAWAFSRRNRPMLMTVEQALTRYIESKSKVLSPATIREYKRSAKADFEMIKGVYLRQLTQEKVQSWVSSLAKEHSAKTVKNIYALYTAATKMFDVAEFKISLPMSVPPDLYTPDDDDIKKLIDYIKKSGKDDLFKAVMLSAFCSMRRSEICALTSDDISDIVISVNKSMVLNEDNVFVIKPIPKTAKSNRLIQAPAFVINMFKGTQGKIVSANPHQITNRFERAIKYSKSKHYRFHDLRHYYVSIAHAIGVPDQYIMESGGWSSPYVMQRVYRGTLRDVRKEESEKMENHFTEKFGFDS